MGNINISQATIESNQPKLQHFTLARNDVVTNEIAKENNSISTL